MENIVISIERIKDTNAWKKLNPIQQSFCLKRSNRSLLSNGLIVHKNTGVVPANVQGYNLSVLEDLILGESVKFEETKSE